jgi:hypothetical protein
MLGLGLLTELCDLSAAIFLRFGVDLDEASNFSVVGFEDGLKLLHLFLVG